MRTETYRSSSSGARPSLCVSGRPEGRPLYCCGVIRWRPSFRRWVPVIIKGLAGAAAFALTVLVAGDERKIWDVSDRTLFLATLSVGIVTALVSVGSSIAGARAGTREGARVRVQKVLIQCLLAVAKEVGVEPDHVGVSAYLPAWRWVRNDDERIGRPRRVLARVERMRLTEDTPPSRVARLKGKAAVGECWATARVVHQPWLKQLRDHSSASLSESEFAQMDAGLKVGLTHREFVAIAHKYSEVLAVPVLSVAGAVIGVLSVDILGKAGRTDLLLNTDAVVAQAETTAKFVGDDLKYLFPMD